MTVFLEDRRAADPPEKTVKGIRVRFGFLVCDCFLWDRFFFSRLLVHCISARGQWREGIIIFGQCSDTFSDWFFSQILVDVLRVCLFCSRRNPFQGRIVVSRQFYLRNEILSMLASKL